jgi:hypothetical protein
MVSELENHSWRKEYNSISHAGRKADESFSAMSKVNSFSV